MAKDKEAMKDTAVYVMVVALIAVMAFNQLQLNGISATGITTTGAATGAAAATGTISLQEAVDAVIPRGVPAVYGNELNVTFEDPLSSLDTLALLDGDLFENGLLKYDDLSAEQKARYLRIGSSIACEFCCGVDTLVFSNGQPSCGCAHSAAMRGLAKYLLINHGDLSDEQILDELTKWKSIFFPKQMIERYVQSNGGSLSGEALPEMVGGC